MARIAVNDVAELLLQLGRQGCSPKTSANALATLQSILRYARRHGWIVDNAVDLLEPDERPRPARRRQRVLGRAEIERLLDASAPRARLMIPTVLYTGLRVSELLGLIWDDVDFDPGLIHVRAQLSRAQRGMPARRVPPKTPGLGGRHPAWRPARTAARGAQTGDMFRAGADWLFATTKGTPQGHRNVTQRDLQRAARRAGLAAHEWPALRFHDLRHTFASHLIVDLGLDVVQVSRILGHARITITLDVYTHLFDDARHGRDIRSRMTGSPFGQLLEAKVDSSKAATISLR